MKLGPGETNQGNVEELWKSSERGTLRERKKIKDKRLIIKQTKMNTWKIKRNVWKERRDEINTRGIIVHGESITTIMNNRKKLTRQNLY